MVDVNCNICRTPQSKFTNTGGALRICSQCGSVERHRVLKHMLHSRAFGRLGMFGRRTLVVAPSIAERNILQSEGISRITSVDIRPEVKPDRIVDISNMPEISDGSYDLIVASFVLCTTKNYLAAISEFNRILAPGGLLFCSDPLHSGQNVDFEGARISQYYGEKQLNDYGVGHFREFGDNQLRDDLEKYFDVNQQKAADPVIGTNITWFLGSKTRNLEPIKTLARTEFKVPIQSKLFVCPLYRRNEFIRIEIDVPDFPAGISDIRFGDHNNREVLCYGNGYALTSSDNGETWTAHPTPECRDAHIMSAFIAPDTYILQAIGKEQGVRLPAKGWATIFTYDRSWNFLGASQPSQSHWHGTCSIGNNNGTLMWATYCVNTDKYKSDYRENPKKYAEFVFPNFIFRSRDGGVSWEPVFEVEVEKVRHFHCVQPDPFFPGTWWASTGDRPEENRVFRSTDDGDTWQDVTGDAQTTALNYYKGGAFRFTAMAFTPDAMLWGTDDWLGTLQAYDPALPVNGRSGSRLFMANRGNRVDLREVAYLGFAARSMTDVGPGWIVTSEAKYQEVSLNPQVFYIPKDDPSGAKFLFSVDNYAWRGTGFTYSRASKFANNGVFFTYRQSQDMFPDGPKVIRWRFNLG